MGSSIRFFFPGNAFVPGGRHRPAFVDPGLTRRIGIADADARAGIDEVWSSSMWPHRRLLCV
jgi:hypothetical protein